VKPSIGYILDHKSVQTWPVSQCVLAHVCLLTAHQCAVEEPSRRSLPSRIRHTVPLVIKEPSAMTADDSGHLPHPSQAPRPAGCRVASPHTAISHLPAPLIAALPFVALVHPAGFCPSSLLTPPPPICWRLCLLSHPSRASHPAG